MKIHGTAKGGALSKKDFGVAFSAGGAAGCTQKWIGTAGSGFSDASITAATDARVEKFAQSGGTTFNVCKFSAYLKKSDTLNATIYAKIWNSSGVKATSDDTYVNDDIDDEYAWFEFEFDDIALAEGEWMGIWYDGNNLYVQQSVSSDGDPTSLDMQGGYYDSGAWGGFSSTRCFNYIIYSS